MRLRLVAVGLVVRWTGLARRRRTVGTVGAVE